MVTVQQKPRTWPSRDSSPCLYYCWRSTTCLLLVPLLLFLRYGWNEPLGHFQRTSTANTSMRKASANPAASSSSISGATTVTLEPIVLPAGGMVARVPSNGVAVAAAMPSCPYRSWDDLAPGERDPRTTSLRHMVAPPLDSRVTLVCCHTTAGPWNVAVHHAWAPHGAARFVEMVQSGYFSHNVTEGSVPLMRCVEDFLCQFGLAGERSAQFASKIPDDPAWLPTGRGDRRNAETGVTRYRRGYLAYAGSGPNSRGRQLIVALVDQSSLGQSPWEVPWGELVGQHSYKTLSNLYTGYGEDGPTQESLVEESGLELAHEDFPDLDWILSCRVVDDRDLTTANGADTPAHVAAVA